MGTITAPRSIAAIHIRMKSMELPQCVARTVPYVIRIKTQNCTKRHDQHSYLLNTLLMQMITNLIQYIVQVKKRQPLLCFWIDLGIVYVTVGYCSVL